MHEKNAIPGEYLSTSRLAFRPGMPCGQVPGTWMVLSSYEIVRGLVTMGELWAAGASIPAARGMWKRSGSGRFHFPLYLLPFKKGEKLHPLGI